MKLIPQLGIAMRSIWVSGFQRYFTWKNFAFPIKLLVSLIQSWRILQSFSPAVVVGTGGYVMGPVLYMASKMGIPVLIQEQNVYPGITTRLLKKYVTRICLAFEGARKYFEDYRSKVVITGNPVRKSLKIGSKSEAAKKWNFDPDKPVVLVFGGSQGARAINSALLKIVPESSQKNGFQLLWQTGEKDYDSVVAQAAGLSHLNIKPYIHEMEDAYSAADIIVSRAGAITLAELAIVQKPVILVPYPFAAGDHQKYNAQLIEEEGAAQVVLEGLEWENELHEAIDSLLEDIPMQKKMASSWKKLAKPDAADQIADEVLQLIGKNKN